MRKFNRALAALLTAGIVSTLTACGGSGTPNTSSTPSSATPETQGTSSTSEPAKPMTNEERYATLENPNITIYGKEKGTDEGFDAKVSAFEAKYGGKVTVILEKDSPENVLKAIAAGAAPDMVPLSNARQSDFLVKAALAPLEDLIDLSDPIFEQAYVAYGTWRGHNYAVGPLAMQKAIVYNKTAFENNGVKTPMEYVDEGTWDFKTFVECAKALTLDTNNDGTIDQWGYGSQDWSYPTAQMNGGNVLAFNHEEPAIDVMINTPETIEALQMYQDALLKDKCFTAAPDNRKAFMENTIAMVFETVGTMKNFKKNMDAEIDLAPYPAGPKGDPLMQPTAMSRYGVPAAAKNPEGGVAWLYLEALGKEAEYDETAKLLFDDAKWQKMKTAGYKFILSEAMFTSPLLGEAGDKFKADFEAGVPVATIAAAVEPMYRRAADDWLKTEADAWTNANK